ncbi:MAG TPA: TlpA disulfide reductase family protein [Candidatus Eremiobacteraceae bacterium]|nr:TlpA disulfide reductase family protein [Candidatus Eremiobacteraceae bacterium]
MKKIVLICLSVLAVLLGTYFADKATRVKSHVGRAVFKSKEGKAAPALSLKDLNDKEVALSDFQGKVVLINFWATWCGPCRIEIPWLIEMQNKYRDKGFVVLGIAMDDEGKSVVAPFVEKERFEVNGQKVPMSYPILIGNDATGNQFGGLLGYPTSFLISRDGKIVKKVQGLVSYGEISKAIESQL